MKIRLDYVTNSSSSSFIITTNESLPEGYEDDFKKITKESLPEIVEDLSYGYGQITYEMDLEEFQELGNFTDEQIMMIQMARAGELSTYLKFVEAIENNVPMYYICVDNNYLYRNEVLENFILNARKNEAIDYEER